MNKKIISTLLVAVTALIFSSCSGGSSYPVAKPIIGTHTKQPVPDHYISPYKPYNPIVAKGFKSGQLAGDPSTIKNDPKTGKPDLSTMKIFKIP
jgi:hypothetical protein